MKKSKEYTNGEVTVVWKPELCFHSEKCWRGLPEVFKPKEKPWIQPEASETSKIVDQVKLCPSGALTYYLNNQGADTEEPREVKVEAMANGPLMLHSSCTITKADGSSEERKDKVAFCRCGQSANKPFCDGSHKGAGFVG